MVLTGGTEKIDETLKNNREAIAILDEVIDKIDHQNLLKYKAHRYAFVTGLIFIFLSRGHAPMAKIGAIFLHIIKAWLPCVT